MKNEFDNELYSKNIIEFITVASEYCGFVEKMEKFSKKDFLEKSQKILALLYLKASMLEKISSDEIEEGVVERFVTELDYNYIVENIAAKIGTHEQFLDVFEPTRNEESEAVQVSVSECFADIYQDLKDFILNYQIGNEQIMLEAIYECQLNFEIFWGPRVLSILSIIHNILYSSDSLEDEDVSDTKIDNNNNVNTNFLKNHYDDFNEQIDADAFDDIF